MVNKEKRTINVVDENKKKSGSVNIVLRYQSLLKTMEEKK